MSDSGGLIAVAFLYVLIPIALGRWINQASWLDIGKAYCLLWGLLFLLGVGMGSNSGERIGWPLIFGMFVSIPAIPILLWIMKLAGRR